MTLVTPAEGTLVLSEAADRDLFRTARVGLGACGVVAEVVLQCVPAHQLLEHTYVSSMKVGGQGANVKSNPSPYAVVREQRRFYKAASAPYMCCM